jgi:hypothetical protein
LDPEYAVLEAHTEAVPDRFDAHAPVLHPQDAAFEANDAGKARFDAKATLGERFDANQAELDENTMEGNRLDANRATFEAHVAVVVADVATLLANVDVFDP